MAKHSVKNIGKLADIIKSKSTDVDKAASNTLNRTATATVVKSVSEITKSVNLQQSYVKKHLNVVARASPTNLRVIIHANERGTLLTRYPHFKTKDGVRVSINKGTGYRELKGAFIVSGLKGSGATGIALRNTTAVEFFENAIAKTGNSGGKLKKLRNIKVKAQVKPNGMEVLHARSVNQLFTSVKEDIKPYIHDFMLSDFLQEFDKKGIK